MGGDPRWKTAAGTTKNKMEGQRYFRPTDFEHQSSRWTYDVQK